MTDEIFRVVVELFLVVVGAFVLVVVFFVVVDFLTAFKLVPPLTPREHTGIMGAGLAVDIGLHPGSAAKGPSTFSGNCSLAEHDAQG